MNIQTHTHTQAHLAVRNVLFIRSEAAKIYGQLSNTYGVALWAKSAPFGKAVFPWVDYRGILLAVVLSTGRRRRILLLFR